MSLKYYPMLVASKFTAGEKHNSMTASCKRRDPAVTNATGNFTGCLDYIFLRGFASVAHVLGLPYEEGLSGELTQNEPHLKPEVKFGPIPDEHFPSDHLPVCCVIKLD